MHASPSRYIPVPTKLCQSKHFWVLDSDLLYHYLVDWILVSVLLKSNEQSFEAKGTITLR